MRWPPEEIVARIRPVLRRFTGFVRRYLTARGVTSKATGARLMKRIRTKARRIRSHTPRTPVGEAARPPAPPE